MVVTKQIVADQLAAYLRHETSLPRLVEWAEHALMESDFDEQSASELSSVVARLGVADVRAFGLSWDDCEQMLKQLGYAARIDIVAA